MAVCHSSADDYNQDWGKMTYEQRNIYSSKEHSRIELQREWKYCRKYGDKNPIGPQT